MLSDSDSLSRASMESVLGSSSNPIDLTGSTEVEILRSPVKVVPGKNASESVNALLKHKVDYKKNELSIFLDKLKEVIDDQERELERAVIDRGKYQFSSEFKHLIKQENNWFLRIH